MLAAVAQICSTPSIARNLTVCKNVIRKAASRGAKLVYLPEASDFIAPSSSVLSLSTSLDTSPFVTGIKEQAKESRVWVGVGIHELGKTETRRVSNTQILINPSGEIAARYEKLHLFDVDIKGVDTPIGQVGLLTCYDIRFPEPSLLLRRRGAEIITYPSAFTMRTGEAHWETLLRARAIETQCYVLAPAQVGEHFPPQVEPATESSEAKVVPGRYSFGKAMIVDPWGTVVARCSDDLSKEADICFADIDLAWLAKIRRDMPLWEQRRDGVYQLQG